MKDDRMGRLKSKFARAVVAVACLAGVGAAVGGATAQTTFDLRKTVPMSGAEIKSAFDNVTLRSTIGGFELYLTHDWGGSFTALTVLGHLEGTWRLEGDEYCWAFETAPPILDLPQEACHLVIRRRSGFALVDRFGLHAGITFSKVR